MSNEIEVNNGNNRVASHLIVTECEIDNGLADLVQNRVKIDRFTGGSYPGALFNQQPVFGRPNSATTLKLKLILRQSSQNNTDFKAQVGLLLLLLKDLWTGDLPLGGEISVGRGRLQGCEAKLADGEQTWHLRQTEHGLEIEGNRAVLEELAQALQEVTK
jgi:CRISPR/Cas system CSM-associated protein Csm3 (group 7 of RAMP superfamily)